MSQKIGVKILSLKIGVQNFELRKISGENCSQWKNSNLENWCR